MFEEKVYTERFCFNKLIYVKKIMPKEEPKVEGKKV